MRSIRHGVRCRSDRPIAPTFSFCRFMHKSQANGGRMDFQLSEELIAVRDVAREFAEKEIAPTAAKDDKGHVVRRDLVKKMGELGFYGSVIPATYGGSGLGFLAMALITEEIARAHSAMRVAINMQIGPALALLQFGTEEQ